MAVDFLVAAEAEAVAAAGRLSSGAAYLCNCPQLLLSHGYPKDKRA